MKPVIKQSILLCMLFYCLNISAQITYKSFTLKNSDTSRLQPPNNFLPSQFISSDFLIQQFILTDSHFENTANKFYFPPYVQGIFCDFEDQLNRNRKLRIDFGTD